MPAMAIVLPPSQLLDVAIVGREEILRNAPDDDREPKGREDLHHAEIDLARIA